MPVEENKAKVLSRPLLVLNNNYSDYNLDFCVFSNGVISRSLTHPRLGVKSEDSDYQGSSEKITFNFRPIERTSRQSRCHGSKMFGRQKTDKVT